MHQEHRESLSAWDNSDASCSVMDSDAKVLECIRKKDFRLHHEEITHREFDREKAKPHLNVFSRSDDNELREWTRPKRTSRRLLLVGSLSISVSAGRLASHG